MKHQKRQFLSYFNYLIYSMLNYGYVKLFGVHGRVFLFVVFVQYWFH